MLLRSSSRKARTPGIASNRTIGVETSWVEMSIDERVCRQKALRVVRRLEALHLLFPTPGWSMRVLCSII